jgi:hypothetical protein
MFFVAGYIVEWNICFGSVSNRNLIFCVLHVDYVYPPLIRFFLLELRQHHKVFRLRFILCQLMFVTHLERIVCLASFTLERLPIVWLALSVSFLDFLLFFIEESLCAFIMDEACTSTTIACLH